MEPERLALFPLHTVLFPGGPLPLRVFEPRYLDLISGCLRNDTGFGICLIREGREVGEAAQTYEVGTLVRITYWNRRADGLLGVTVRGERRFRLRHTEVGNNQLLSAAVEWLPAEPPLPLPARHRHLAQMLERIMDQLDHPYVHLEKHYDDATWVAGRLAELLPIDLAQKQYLLQLDDPEQRLGRLAEIIAAEFR